MGNRFDQDFKFYENIKYINIKNIKNIKNINIIMNEKRKYNNIIISYFILL